MASRTQTQQTVLTGIFVAIGLVLPYLTAHAFGIPGTILLPMHIPVLLCGLLCGSRYGVLCGITTPLLSSLVLGMPVLYPMLPIMLLQLASIGFFSGLLYRRFKFKIYPTLLLSMVIGWFIYGLAFSGLLFADDAPLRAPSVLTAIMAGIPGSIIQLLLIPALLFALRKYRLIPSESLTHSSAALIQAKVLITQGSCGCVIIRNGTIVHTGKGRGVSPLIHLYEEKRELLFGSSVVDKIIGKAAAIILVLGGVSKVHGLTMSIAAKDYLTKHGIAVSYDRLIDVIANRNRDGICSVERSVLHLDDPAEGLSCIRNTIKQLMSTG